MIFNNSPIYEKLQISDSLFHFPEFYELIKKKFLDFCKSKLDIKKKMLVPVG